MGPSWAGSIPKPRQLIVCTLQRLPRLCAPVRRLLSLPRHFYSHASPDPVSSTAAARATAPEGVSLDGLTTVAVIPTACQAAVAPSGRGASGSQGPWHTYSRPREPGAWGSFNQRCHGLGSRELEQHAVGLGRADLPDACAGRLNLGTRSQPLAATIRASVVDLLEVFFERSAAADNHRAGQS